MLSAVSWPSSQVRILHARRVWSCFWCFRSSTWFCEECLFPLGIGLQVLHERQAWHAEEDFWPSWNSRAEGCPNTFLELFVHFKVALCFQGQQTFASFIHLIRWPTCKDIDACIEREDAKRAVVCSGSSWGCVARAADTEPANILFTVNAAFKCFNQTGSIFRTVWFIRVCVYYLSLPESDISMGSFASFNSTSTRIYCLLSEADGRRAAQGIQRALTATCCNNFIHQIFQMCIYANISGTC